MDTLNGNDLLDTRRAVETPEGVTLELRLAGPVVRSLAWAIDGIIRYAILIGGVLLLGGIGDTGVGLGLILFFLLEWFYPVLFEVYRDGATPGKQVFRLRVISDDGTPVDFSASLTRNLLRAADFLPLMYGFGLVTMLLNRDAKRLGDLAAGTLVIYTDAVPDGKPDGKPNGRPGASADAGTVLPLRTALSAAEQRLVVNFADRTDQLSEARREELARLLPVLGEAPAGCAAQQRLLGHARWLRGEDLTT